MVAFSSVVLNDFWETIEELLPLFVEVAILLFWTQYVTTKLREIVGDFLLLNLKVLVYAKHVYGTYSHYSLETYLMRFRVPSLEGR